MTYLMTLDEILTHLETTDCSTFQREALQEAVKQQQEITPALLAIIERAANDPQWLNEALDYMGFAYALYLLAQFREKRAYPIMGVNQQKALKFHGILANLLPRKAYRRFSISQFWLLLEVIF